MNAHGSHTGSKDTDGFVAAVPSQLGLPSIPSLPAPFFLFLSLSSLSSSSSFSNTRRNPRFFRFRESHALVS